MLSTQFITWVNNDTATWTMKAAGMSADDDLEISARPISQEPMVGTFLSFPCLATHTRIVSHHEFGNIREFWWHRLGRSGIPCCDDHRLDPGVPEEGRDKHRMFVDLNLQVYFKLADDFHLRRSGELPHSSIYKRVSSK